MKKLLLIIFLLISKILFSQIGGMVEYKFYYKKFTETPKNDNIAQARRTADLIAEYAKDHRYILKFNNLESLYHVEDSMPLDDVYDKFAYKFSKYAFSMGIFYQNNESGEVLNKKVTMGKIFLVRDKLQNNWKITKETKYIGKYKCYKAISKCGGCDENQTIVAWFTPEIPIQFGPGGIGGTPGLILEVSKYRYTLRLKKIKLSKKYISIEKPTEGILITADKLKELQWESRMKLKNNRN